MFRNKYATCLVALLSCGALLSGCSKKKSSEEHAPAAAASAKPSGADSLMVQIQELAKTCDVVEASSGLKCKGGEQRKLVSQFAREKSRAGSLGTIAQALRDRDPKVQTVAANLLHLGFRSSLGSEAKQGDVSADVTKGLIDAVAELPKAQASQALPATVHAAMLSGQQDALYKMLEKRSQDRLATVAYRYLMTHGRMDAFPKIKEIVAGDQLDLALAAAASPNSMRDWSADEEKQICEWANELLGDERVGIATRAAALLGHCSGPYVDTLLGKGEELLKAGKLSQAQITPFRDVCSAARRRAKPGEEPKVSDEQCARNRKFLEKVLSTSGVDPRTKAMVLSALAYQWPDEDTLKLMKKYENDPDKDLAKRANDMVRRLDRKNSQKPTQPKAGDTAHGSAPAPVKPAGATTAPKPAASSAP